MPTLATPDAIPARGEPAPGAQPAPDPAPRDATLAAEELTVMGLFAETYAALEALFGRQVAGHDLSPVEFEVLLRLARSPEHRLRMSDLAAQAALTTSGATRIVDRLEQRELVQRQPCWTDRRTTYTVVTTTGLDLMHAVLPGHVALIRENVTGPLKDAGTLADLTGALRLLRDRLAPCATAGSREATTATDCDPPTATG